MKIYKKNPTQRPDIQSTFASITTNVIESNQIIFNLEGIQLTLNISYYLLFNCYKISKIYLSTELFPPQKKIALSYTTEKRLKYSEPFNTTSYKIYRNVRNHTHTCASRGVTVIIENKTILNPNILPSPLLIDATTISFLTKKHGNTYKDYICIYPQNNEIRKSDIDIKAVNFSLILLGDIHSKSIIVSPKKLTQMT